MSEVRVSVTAAAGCTRKGRAVNGRATLVLMKRRDRWEWVLAAALAGVGCQAEETGLGDAGASDDRREICFPSCRLGEVCTADNRCVTPTNPFRDAGFARDRGAD
jgi:hypothetical protein